MMQMWPNSPAMPFSPMMRRPSARMAAPTPSARVRRTALRMPSMRPNQSSERRQALAAFSISTGDAELFGEGFADVEVLPVKIGGHEEAVGLGVDSAGDADADAFDGALVVFGAKTLHDFGDAFDALLDVAAEGDELAGEEAAVEVNEGDDGLVGADVGGEGRRGRR